MRNLELAPLSFQSGNLEIRAYRPGDGAALAEAAVESYEHLKPWMPWAKAEQSVEESEIICRRAIARFFKNEDYTMGIWVGGEYVGGTGFHLRCGPIAWGSAEIGMWIRASRDGTGIGTRTLKAMLEWGFGEWGWERLIWKCDTRNIGSARVAEKNGLKRESTLQSDALDVDGHRRDTHLYAILKPEYLEATAKADE